jgi:hypothetical protein
MPIAGDDLLTIVEDAPFAHPPRPCFVPLRNV